MADLLLTERDQAALRAVVGTEPEPGAGLPASNVLPHLARLIPCDACGMALLDDTAPSVVGERDGETAHGLHGRSPGVGIQQRDRDHVADEPSTARGVAVLSLGVGNGSDHVLRLWMVRRTRNFTSRDRALLALVAPALIRLMRERAAPVPTESLTAQERRVLRLVARGLSNAEVAERLGIAPCTVRKHLEHAYRKLGVTNRMAAVVALADVTQPAPEQDRADALT